MLPFAADASGHRPGVTGPATRTSSGSGAIGGLGRGSRRPGKAEVPGSIPRRSAIGGAPDGAAWPDADVWPDAGAWPDAEGDWRWGAGHDPWHCASAGPVVLAEVDGSDAAPWPTGLPELDAVLGGGLVPGSVTLVGGEPGVGKSTLLLQVLRSVAEGGQVAVLVSAEESARQVRLRAERLGPIPPTVLVHATTDISVLDDLVRRAHPSLVVVDSIQTVADGEVAGPAGSLAQVRACAERCVALAKVDDVAVVLVGHVTKDGSLAGPRALEHVVDTVVTVEGDRHHALRMVRTVKHRFGATGELGLFEMGDSGLCTVADPYRYLLGDRHPESPGSAVVAAMDGQRALLVEVQALVAESMAGVAPRRSAQGVDGGRLAQILAVLAARMRAVPSQIDVFASVVGGVRVVEPAADLAVALAVVSSVRGQPLPADLVVFGEVGLGGELRHVPHGARRVAGASAAGFRRALVPAGMAGIAATSGMEVLAVSHLSDAVGAILDTVEPLAGASRRRSVPRPPTVSAAGGHDDQPARGPGATR